MSEEKYLGGKVLKRTLAVVHPPVPPDSTVLKRLMLPQGELAQFFDGEEPARYIAYIELAAGGVRGNHFHKVKAEWVYLIKGEVVVHLLDLESDARDKLTLREGDLAFISTHVAHALQTLQAGQAIEFSSARFDPADIHRMQVFKLEESVSR